MADSTASTVCAICGGPLDDYDLDRGTCHDCRSPRGKIADLDIAIRASGDNPKRISDWPVLRRLLHERFGEDRSDAELWEQCTGWLQTGGLEPNYYLELPIEALTGLLQKGLALGSQEELDRLMFQHRAERAAHRSKALAEERNEAKPVERLPLDPAAETSISSTAEPQGLTQLDQFPDTPAGHVAFVEMVCDEIRYAANGKRHQLTEKYSNDTIASMVRGRDSLMAEAVQRLATLSEVHTEVVEQVVRVLRRELTPGTVERIDELLTPATRSLRDAWEDRDAPSHPVASGENDFIDRLLSGPDDAELLSRELALLEAYLQQPVSMATIHRDKRSNGESETNAKRNKLKLICDFNRNLRNEPGGQTRQTEKAGPTESTTQLVEGDGQDGGSNRHAVLAQLKPAHRRAYFSFLYAEAKQGMRLEDRDAWEWLRDHEIQGAQQNELQDYELPAFDTWCRYLRFARKSLNELKYTPRSGRMRSG